ncbi:MAG: IS21 family transposase [Proteobacteria bacterium]|nr:IS21 family transposase [Pseudomonadota bacterium]
MSAELREQIAWLKTCGYGTRRIAQRVGLSRKVIRRILFERGLLATVTATPSKLAPYRTLIRDKVKDDLTVSRILREIRAQGYTGGRTILAEYVRSLRTELAIRPRTKKVKRRFETPPGRELQIDWSPYRVPIAGRECVVHAFGAVLCSSRKLWVHFYRDERQATLLEAITAAFEYFSGCALRLVLDNMATAVLGRHGCDGAVLWHPRLLDHAKHYGYTPFACAVRDPDRKGKDEKAFRYVWDDFLKGSSFTSWEELNQRVIDWLDHTPQTGNLRVHGTTGEVPNEAWLAEREFLIPVPEQRFPVYEHGLRSVDSDATLSIRGTRYTVPSHLATRSVLVRLFAEHFEVLDSQHQVAFARRYVADGDKGKLQLDPSHYATLPRRPRQTIPAERLDRVFITRFPELTPLADGITHRLNRLAPIHFRALLRLAQSYGLEAFRAAALRAQSFRRFDAHAVERILLAQYPLHDLDADSAPLGGIGAVLLGDVESGSLDAYSELDTAPADPFHLPPHNDMDKPHGSN